MPAAGECPRIWLKSSKLACNIVFSTTKYSLKKVEPNDYEILYWELFGSVTETRWLFCTMHCRKKQCSALSAYPVFSGSYCITFQYLLSWEEVLDDNILTFSNSQIKNFCTYSYKTIPSVTTAHGKYWYAWMKVQSRKLSDWNWLSSIDKPLDKLRELVS